jgi:hypothetical protein
MQKTSIIRALCLMTTIAAAPLAYSPQDGVGAAEACAQTVKNPGTGTCCFQDNAMCVTPTGNIRSAYFKSEGPC